MKKNVHPYKHLSFYIILVILLSGCEAQKYAKIALKYEEAGMYKLAVENYLLSLGKKNDNNDKAKIGLMRSSKRYSDEVVAKIEDAYNNLNDDQVVRYYQDLISLQKQTIVYKIEIDINNKTVGQYNESKNRFLRNLYSQAQSLMDKEMFEEATRKFGEILKIDSTYERCKEFYIFSFCEPIYRNAKLDLRNKLYRSAYYKLSQILKVDANFKDSKELQTEALQNGLLTIAIKSVNNSFRFPFLYEQTISEIKKSFDKNTNPFLKLVSLDNTQAMLNEQKKALENNISIDPNMLIPVRVYLTGDILSSDFWLSKRVQTEKKAYLRYLDRNNLIRYKKVYYYEYQQSCYATCKLNYEFVSVETSSILAFDKIEKTYSDNINYAASEYNKDDLFPADWGEGQKDTMYTDFARKNAMSIRFAARSVLLNQQDFERSFATTAALLLFKKINEYDPEK